MGKDRLSGIGVEIVKSVRYWVLGCSVPHRSPSRPHSFAPAQTGHRAAVRRGDIESEITRHLETSAALHTWEKEKEKQEINKQRSLEVGSRAALCTVGNRRPNALKSVDRFASSSLLPYSSATTACCSTTYPFPAPSLLPHTTKRDVSRLLSRHRKTSIYALGVQLQSPHSLRRRRYVLALVVADTDKYRLSSGVLGDPTALRQVQTHHG